MNTQEKSNLETEEKELFELYDKLFSSKPNIYSLEAAAICKNLKAKYKKEEIRTVAEILVALAKAPSFLDLESSS